MKMVVFCLVCIVALGIVGFALYFYSKDYFRPGSSFDWFALPKAIAKRIPLKKDDVVINPPEIFIPAASSRLVTSEITNRADRPLYAVCIRVARKDGSKIAEKDLSLSLGKDPKREAFANAPFSTDELGFHVIEPDGKSSVILWFRRIGRGDSISLKISHGDNVAAPLDLILSVLSTSETPPESEAPSYQKGGSIPFPDSLGGYRAEGILMLKLHEEPEYEKDARMLRESNLFAGHVKALLEKEIPAAALPKMYPLGWALIGLHGEGPVYEIASSRTPYALDIDPKKMRFTYLTLTRGDLLLENVTRNDQTAYSESLIATGEFKTGQFAHTFIKDALVSVRLVHKNNKQVAFLIGFEPKPKALVQESMQHLEVAANAIKKLYTDTLAVVALGQLANTVTNVKAAYDS